ncbi:MULTISPECIES: mechanosensitive ion channel family protein [Zunongwangia]|jgi:small-conductance mechanosensitive channel|uniref:mechanosensitive ion channel family protein n=1 Tax=Zunongwangia TaxID=417127 RepID=UPI001D1931F5|nr:mechanosensitive ion channel domain-containing protein [Zunongwangia profunda]MCC4230622.1 mechanosensitive ion channel family protein [Zunongwangia profunda]|tara:strand:- start:4955 stop:6061 length:1107 start_codon:yes stop_codon:yes gene_type:complete
MTQNILNDEALNTSYLIVGILAVVVVFVIAFFIIKKIGKDPKNILPVNLAGRIRIPLLIFLLSLFLKLCLLEDVFSNKELIRLIKHSSTIGIIISFTWFLIVFLKVFKERLLKKYDVNTDDNLKARKVYTQFTILENIVIFILIILAIGISLMSFDSIRQVGLSLLTSAGIAGIILGLAAQKAIGTLLAGIQIAITQPIRLQDAVIVEGEWGWIEEITLTYVVVKIWDKRRLVVPSTYFIENTFQNWTRKSADIMGTVFLYTDYDVSFDAIRAELTRLLEGSPLWDKQVNVLQVTDATEKSVQIRILVSAKDSPTAWDLRVYIREKIIDFIRENYPHSLPKTRVVLPQQDQNPSESISPEKNPSTTTQ